MQQLEPNVLTWSSPIQGHHLHSTKVTNSIPHQQIETIACIIAIVAIRKSVQLVGSCAETSDSEAKIKNARDVPGLQIFHESASLLGLPKEEERAPREEARL